MGTSGHITWINKNSSACFSTVSGTINGHCQHWWCWLLILKLHQADHWLRQLTIADLMPKSSHTMLHPMFCDRSPPPSDSKADGFRLRLMAGILCEELIENDRNYTEMIETRHVIIISYLFSIHFMKFWKWWKLDIVISRIESTSQKKKTSKRSDSFKKPEKIAEQSAMEFFLPNLYCSLRICIR